MHWVWLIVGGAVIGALGRLLHPGPDPLGVVVTTLIGIASLLIAGAIFSATWAEWLVGVLAAVVLVTIFSRFTSRPAV